MVINIEMGHMTNREEDEKLSNPEYQKKMAQGLCNGILEYFKTKRQKAKLRDLYKNLGSQSINLKNCKDAKKTDKENLNGKFRSSRDIEEGIGT